MPQINKQVALLRQLRATGIPLIGRRFGVTNNGSPCCDPSQHPAETIDITPGVGSPVIRWGRVTQYGNANSYLTVDIDGTLYWFMAQEQDRANRLAIRHLLRALPRRRSQDVTIDWYL